MSTINFKTLIINKNNQKENHIGWTKLRVARRKKCKGTTKISVRVKGKI